MGDRQREAMTCEDFERLLVFYVWDALEVAERAAVEQHTRQCPACAALLARESKLHDSLAQIERPAEKLDPADLLLAQCRSQFGEVLDDAAESRARRSWWHAWRPAGWLVPSFVRHPAWSAALLVLLGVALGTVVPHWYRSQTAQPSGTPVIVSASPRLSDQDLQTMGIAGINWVPDSSSGSPSVEVHLRAEKPLVVQGSVDDTDVKRVLTFVVQNGQRFDPGVRLDSVEVLRARSGDRDVRQALCTAARKDRNPGVRLKALEALRGFEQEDNVRQALLDTLLSDDNPGVRVEAINALRALAERGTLDDQRVVSVLRDRMQRDPNNYVRMQSAAAMRQLGPHAVY